MEAATPQPLLSATPFTHRVFLLFPFLWFLLHDQRKEGRLKEAVVCSALWRSSEKAGLWA